MLESFTPVKTRVWSLKETPQPPDIPAFAGKSSLGGTEHKDTHNVT